MKQNNNAFFIPSQPAKTGSVKHSTLEVPKILLPTLWLHIVNQFFVEAGDTCKTLPINQKVTGIIYFSKVSLLRGEL